MTKPGKKGAVTRRHARRIVQVVERVLKKLLLLLYAFFTYLETAPPEFE
jgi:hypothetical protein